MKIIVVIPTLEPSGQLIDYVDRLLTQSRAEVLVVNDGSAVEYQDIFDEIADKSGCSVLHHEENFGKGVAIKNAVKYLSQHRPDIDAVITADSDGQHSVKDVVRLAERLREKPNDLVLGVREFGEETPKRSLMGNAFSSKALGLLYGIKLGDTQTGLRAISKKYFDWLVALPGERYEYELNMLIYSKNIGLEIDTVTIETIYFDNNSASHFHTVRDGSRVFFHMLKGLFRYIGNSLISAMVDISFFTLLFYLTDSFLTATIATTLSAFTARVISSVVDFKLNRKTFASKDTTTRKAYFKYYALWTAQLALSTTLVNVMNIYFGALQPIMKPIVDLILAVLSYKVQLHWVFKAEKSGEDMAFSSATSFLRFVPIQRTVNRLTQRSRG